MKGNVIGHLRIYNIKSGIGEWPFYDLITIWSKDLGAYA